MVAVVNARLVLASEGIPRAEAFTRGYKTRTINGKKSAVSRMSSAHSQACTYVGETRAAGGREGERREGASERERVGERGERERESDRERIQYNCTHVYRVDGNILERILKYLLVV